MELGQGPRKVNEVELYGPICHRPAYLRSVVVPREKSLYSRNKDPQLEDQFISPITCSCHRTVGPQLVLVLILVGLSLRRPYSDNIIIGLGLSYLIKLLA